MAFLNDVGQEGYHWFDYRNKWYSDTVIIPINLLQLVVELLRLDSPLISD
jgi:hypothetical protein